VLTKKEKIFSLMIAYGPMVRTEKKHKEKENKKCYTANMDQQSEQRKTTKKKKIKNVTQLTVFGCNS
jgi:hypothetical protein